MSWLIDWIFRLTFHWRGKHRWVWVRNIYGDEINAVNARSKWKCELCTAVQYRNDSWQEMEK